MFNNLSSEEVYPPHRLKQNELSKLYKRVVEKTQEAIIITNLDSLDFFKSKIVYANKSFCEMSGYTFDEIINKSPNFFQNLTSRTENLDELSNTLSGEEDINFELINRRKDDTLYEVDVQLFPINDNYSSFGHWIFTQKNIATVRSIEQIIEISKKFNYAILENSLDCLKIIDQDGRLQYMNNNGLCLMEIDDFENHKGKYWWDLWGENNKELVKNSLLKALKGETVQFNAFCYTSKGTPKWWDITLSLVKNELNGEAQIISTSRDITARKENEEALKKSQERLVSGLKIANVALAEIDYSTNIVQLTPEAAQLYGLPVSELKISRAKLHSTFHPNFKHSIEEEIVKLLHPNGNGIMEMEHPIIVKSGEVRWLKVDKIVYFDKTVNPPKPIYSVLAAQDITLRKQNEEELKENENRFRTLANSIPQLAWIMNSKGVIHWYNERWYNYTGTTSVDMENEGWHHVHHPNLLPSVLEKFNAAFEAGKDWEDTFLLKNKEGQYRWFLSRAIPVRNNQGEILQWLGTNTDVSQHMELQEELNQLNASLEEKVRERTEELMTKNTELELMNEELSSFSFVASHDLQEPLRKIQSFSKRILELEKFSEKTGDYFTRIISASERMQNLINDLLSFSRTNTLELDLFPCNLNTILMEVQHFHVESIREKNAIIESDQLPTVKGVSILFSQLFSNLIGNAIKYSKHDVPPHINIHSTTIQGRDINLPNVNKEKEYYCITFADNGIGFQQEYADKIFKLFQRLHRREDFSGTGIGLTICKKIVTRLNGFITAEGKPNVGATFKVYIPK